MRVLLALALALILVGEAYGDPCAVCVGEVRYIHIPKGQRDDAKIFTTAGLPKVHDRAVLKEHVLAIDTLSDSQLAGELAAAVERDRQLPRGEELDSGAQLVILGYRFFPDLKELFARVLILSNGAAP